MSERTIIIFSCFISVIIMSIIISAIYFGAVIAGEKAKPQPEPIQIEMSDVLITFPSEPAFKHWQARMIGNEYMAKRMYWMFDLINEEEYKEMGQSLFTIFLMDAMTGKEFNQEKAKK